MNTVPTLGTEGGRPDPRPARPRRRPSTRLGVTVCAALVALAVSAAGTPAYAQERAAPPPDDLRLAEPGRDVGVEVSWLAGGVVPARQVPDRLVAGPQAAPGGASAPAADSLSAGPSGGSAAVEPIGDLLIGNHGCAQLEESEALPHGQNCIDTARVYADGKVHVHTQVPATISVQVSDEPALDGTAEGDVLPILYGPSDQSKSRVYDFWSKPFDLQFGTTHYISAKAWDSDGNLSWRYGEVTTADRTVRISFEKIYIADDADKTGGSFLNDGEIEFFFRVNHEWQPGLHLPEQTLGIGEVPLPDFHGGFYDANDSGNLDIAVQGVEHDDDCGFNSSAPPPFDNGGSGGGGDVGECYDYATVPFDIDLDAHEPGDTVYKYVNDYYLKFSVTVRIDILIG